MYLVVPPGGSFSDTRRIELGPGALTIGRAETCEVRVDIPGVDQEHAKISEVALIALGPDCAIGDVPLDAGSRRLVMPGDEIQIGSIVLALEGHDPSLMPPPPDADVTERMMHGGAKPMDGPRVRVVEGSNFGDELLLKEEGYEYVVGRGANCDLVVDDREVSREHVKIMRKGYLVYVKDLSSTRGSWLGRSAVYTGATVEWSRPRMLRVGATVLSLDLPEAIRRAAPGAQPSAPMTPPPRSRSNLGGASPTPSAPGVAPVSLPSEPPPGSAGGGVISASGAPAPSGGFGDRGDRATQKLGAYGYDPANPHGQAPPPFTPPMPPPGAMPSQAPMPPPVVYAAQVPQPAGSSRVLGPVLVGAPQAGHPSRKAWKKTGPTIGKASGLLLLALAGLVILGGLFVVFSLLE